MTLPDAPVDRDVNVTIARLLQAHSSLGSSPHALLTPGRRFLTYDRLLTQVSDTVQALNTHGISRGDCVAVVLDHSPEAAVCLLAVSAAATCAPLNPLYRVSEYAFYLADLQPKALIVREQSASAAQRVARARGIPIITLTALMGEPAGVFRLTFPTPPVRAHAAPVFADPGDVALVLHTSGTTAHPKLVPLTHANLCYSATRMGTGLALGAADRGVSVMPLFHVHGFVGTLLASIAAGATLICPDSPGVARFWACARDYQPTWYTAVPTLHQTILAQRPADTRTALAQLRFVRSCSAALPAAVQTQLEDVFQVPVIEAYGMTEAAHQIASNPLPPGIRKPRSVGRPLGTDVAVLDDAGDPLAPHQEGDIVVRGPNVITAYANAQSSPEDSFVRGWLRTGDRGWLDAEGYLFLTGRAKEIINRGGEKISPREIDGTLMAHPAVEAALAFGYPDARLGEEIGAAVVRRADAGVSERQLREFAAGRLADFKVPRRIVFLAALPTGPSGKPIRQGLAAMVDAPDAPAGRHATEFVAPRSATEALLCEIWSQVLGKREIGVFDNFFELGGDSILAAEVLARVWTRAGVQLSLVDVLDVPTVADVARRVDHRASAVQSPSAERDAPGAPPPLTFAQRRMWFTSHLDGDSADHTVTLVIRLEGELKVAALAWSLNEILKRHAVLRTTFVNLEGEPQPVVQAAAPIAMSTTTLSDLPAAEQDQHVTDILAQARNRPFDLARGPLIRAALITVSAREHVLQLAMPHLVADAGARQTLYWELRTLYGAAANRRPSPLPPLDAQYGDYAAWERQWLSPERLQQGVAFWRTQLAGAPSAVPLWAASPASESPPADPGVHLATEEVMRFSPELTQRLQAFSARAGVSLFMTLAAALQTLLHRVTAQDDIVLGFPVSLRHRGPWQSLIGLFLNTLVLRTTFEDAPTFDGVLRRVQDAALAGYAYQDVPFDHVVQALQPARRLGETPLFNVLLDLVEGWAVADAGGVTFVPLDEPVRAPNLDLTLHVMPQDRGLRVRAIARPGLATPRQVTDLLQQYRSLCEQVVADPSKPVRSYELSASTSGALASAPAHDTARMPPRAWNDTARVYPSGGVHQLVEEQARRRPQAVAVVEGDARLTYDALNRRANGLAHQLRAAGVTRDVPVGVCLDRSADMIVAWLAVLKAGGAYVPLDPAHPRLAFLLEDTGIGVVITDAPGRARLPPDDPATVVDVSAAAAGDPDNLPGETRGEDLAYIVYTSGSTGTPKGVEVPHRGIVRLLCNVDYATFDADRVWLHMGPPAFDVSTLEVWGPLVHGACCVVLRGRVPTLDEIGTAIARHGVTSAWLTTGLFNTIVDESPHILAPLRQLLVGGEALSVPHVRRAYAALATTELINGYGPTESTTFATCYAIPRAVPPDLRSIPIGRPIANTRAYVLDDRRRPVPVGVPGELFLAGDGLARGYRHRPALTAARFIDGHMVGETRLYQTGDRVQYQADGTLEFLGRLDDQVKIRGFRVEPGEIEAALLAHPAVQQCAVTVGQGRQGEKVLTAHVVLRHPAADAADLRSYLATRLPEYMVPDVVAVREALPLGPHGKIDRAALQPAARQGAAYVAPRDPTEQTLVAIWERLLEVQPIGVTDDFFARGGNSLTALRLVAHIKKDLGLKLSVSAVFQSPTIEQLARALRAEQG